AVRKEELAQIITLEMGKLIGEARAEIEKCISGCEYYAEQGPVFLKDESIATDAGKSFVAYQPLGTVLAVMPWNFPFWQVFRFAAPALIAGNTAVLKHASNVPQCAIAIEKLFIEAGFPQGVFQTLLIPASLVSLVIEDPIIKAVTLTGSEAAGKKVASLAAVNLKKSVLELGGSDAFVVLEDADLDRAVKTAVMARFLNAGQSCIAAKRFIVVETIANEFIERFKCEVEKLTIGDPASETTTLAPMARHDLRDELHEQVQASLKKGAKVITGCLPEDHPGAFYQASILDGVVAGMRAWDEELFGPVASMIRARDEQEALTIANSSRFGLGGSVWTRDRDRGEHFARRLESGAAFVNSMVKSDPRLPFGGINASGYGRELSYHGMYEFVNIKTIWVD
ncbi:MAG: NAD-dependent succinate-semialdehyde dehydrogenase, partial [Gammaproteobacteria bacterium]|nr:NAD-dependent succinate-semialdehyde dehydrogenase [Gammaproteobacteria bacterium]